MDFLPLDLNNDGEFDAHLCDLPPLLPRFFVPSLSNVPQNPIMDTLKRDEARLKMPFHTVLDAMDNLEPLPGILEPPPVRDDIWIGAVKERDQASRILSWDALHPKHFSLPSSGPFLSDQDDITFAAARYTLIPTVNDGRQIVHINSQSLVENLQRTVLGLASSIHPWDQENEKFVTCDKDFNGDGVLLIDGRDEMISSSLIIPFLKTGNLLRRLEIFSSSIHPETSRQGPITSAFKHALAMILSFLRDKITLINKAASKMESISTIQRLYIPYYDVLVALAEVCKRDLKTPPSEYAYLDYRPHKFLSHLYKHLDLYTERQSPPLVLSILSYLLTTVSHEYMQKISRSVGYGGDLNRRTSHVVGERNDQYSMLNLDNTEIDTGDNIEFDDDALPSFLPPQLVDILPAAQKSLVLLRVAQPQHPVLKPPQHHRVLKWFWSTRDVEASTKPTSFHEKLPSSDTAATIPCLYCPSPDTDLLDDFKIYDLEPGNQVNLVPKGVLSTSVSSSDNVEAFVHRYPDSLPSITPTLSHLTALVFRPLIEHSIALSGALLAYLLLPSTPLNIHTHMEVLRSYLLLSSAHFRRGLSLALFSDEGHPEDENRALQSRMSFRHLRRRRSSKKDIDTSISRPWSVGIASALLDGNAWPPVGSELSYYLRTVIIDSFEASGMQSDLGLETRQQLLEEAEKRLGFAIRDMSEESENWLDPSTIEALDFLYLDYKPPNPLHVIITPEILSQYQRMFMFLLRLLRVQHAINAVFRMTTVSQPPLFPTFVASQKLLNHFRFVAQSFVSSLSSYVFDVAIGGNFDVFLHRLMPNAPMFLHTGETSQFSDVFALARAHFFLLNDILSACLLRTSQRSIGDALKEIIQLVIDFSVLVGELRRQRLEEYEAEGLLVKLFDRFRSKMTIFIQLLRASDKTQESDLAITKMMNLSDRDHIAKPPGGVDALCQLLVRIDFSEWWSNTAI